MSTHPKITTKILRQDLPEIVYFKDGSVNVVLAVYSDSIYCETNTYIPKWTVTNTAYYNAHPKEFLGWIPLEDLHPPCFKNEPKSEPAIKESLTTQGAMDEDKAFEEWFKSRMGWEPNPRDSSVISHKAAWQVCAKLKDEEAAQEISNLMARIETHLSTITKLKAQLAAKDEEIKRLEVLAEIHSARDILAQKWNLEAALHGALALLKDHHDCYHPEYSFYQESELCLRTKEALKDFNNDKK